MWIGVLLKPYIQQDGYERVALSKFNFPKTRFVHRIVAITFIPNPENKPQVNHKNGIKWDNRVENLEWVTMYENREHAIENGFVGRRGKLIIR